VWLSQIQIKWTSDQRKKVWSFKFRGVTKNNDLYNVCLVVVNTSGSADRINKVQIGAIPINETTVYCNGTQQFGTNAISYYLKSGDTLQANIFFPATDQALGATIGVTVYTQQAMYYQETTLPQ
jgi:uncharacterized secreted protein with C-terminal beta-propeller domain